MPRNRSQSHSHHHIEDGLRYQQQGYADDEEGRESSVALLGNASHTYQQADVKEYHYDSSHQSELFNDNGKDEVGKCLAQEVALYGIAGAFADDITGGNGDACMGYLRVFVYIEFGSRYLIVICKLLNTGTLCVETVQEW